MINYNRVRELVTRQASRELVTRQASRELVTSQASRELVTRRAASSSICCLQLYSSNTGSCPSFAREQESNTGKKGLCNTAVIRARTKERPFLARVADKTRWKIDKRRGLAQDKRAQDDRTDKTFSHPFCQPCLLTTPSALTQTHQKHRHTHTKTPFLPGLPTEPTRPLGPGMPSAPGRPGGPGAPSFPGAPFLPDKPLQLPFHTHYIKYL
jgi:hypothetical protein